MGMSDKKKTHTHINKKKVIGKSSDWGDKKKPTQTG